jgi:glycosyltransferase involved in cell wall biosynthesis
MLGEKCAAKFADEIIVLSKGVQQYFQDTYGRETVFIPNGVTKPEIREAQLIIEQYGLKKDDYILFLGRLVPEKGVAYLIDAFKNVRTDKKLVIAGGSSDTAAFAQELKDRAAGDARILFTGFVQGRMLEELYSNAYVYVLPSDLEGMPLSLLEAMSYGNCCVTSDIEECAAVMEEYGATFPKGDVSALVETLQRLCDAPQLVDAYKQQAADYITGKYSWDDVTEKTLELYR